MIELGLLELDTTTPEQRIVIAGDDDLNSYLIA